MTIIKLTRAMYNITLRIGISYNSALSTIGLEQLIFHQRSSFTEAQTLCQAKIANTKFRFPIVLD